MTRKLAAAALAVTAALALTACGNEPQESNRGISESTEHLSDGRTVTCLALKNGYAGGLSCDWDNAR